MVLSNSTRIEGTEIKIDIGNLYMNCSNISDLLWIRGSTMYKVNMTVNIDNLVQTDSHVWDGGEGALLYDYGAGMALNNIVTSISSQQYWMPLYEFVISLRTQQTKTTDSI
jgi:hypothetical protein